MVAAMKMFEQQAKLALEDTINELLKEVEDTHARVRLRAAFQNYKSLIDLTLLAPEPAPKAEPLASPAIAGLLPARVPERRVIPFPAAEPAPERPMTTFERVLAEADEARRTHHERQTQAVREHYQRRPDLAARRAENDPRFASRHQVEDAMASPGWWRDKRLWGGGWDDHSTVNRPCEAMALAAICDPDVYDYSLSVMMNIDDDDEIDLFGKLDD